MPLLGKLLTGDLLWVALSRRNLSSFGFESLRMFDGRRWLRGGELV